MDLSKKFQTYTSAKKSMKMVTDTGITVIFVNYKLITDNPNICAYLDREIENGFTYVTKGEPVTSVEADPMASLKARIIAEHEEQKAKDAADLLIKGPKNMGTSVQPKLSPAGTNKLAGSAALSTSS